MCLLYCSMTLKIVPTFLPIDEPKMIISGLSLERPVNSDRTDLTPCSLWHTSRYISTFRSYKVARSSTCLGLMCSRRHGGDVSLIKFAGMRASSSCCVLSRVMPRTCLAISLFISLKDYWCDCLFILCYWIDIGRLTSTNLFAGPPACSYDLLKTSNLAAVGPTTQPCTPFLIMPAFS